MKCSSKVTPEWFAGFVDGEGSLSVANHGGNYQPRFRLKLRDDDADVINSLHNFLGVGSIFRSISRETHKYWTPRCRDQIGVSVAGYDCLRVIEILDQAP